MRVSSTLLVSALPAALLSAALAWAAEVATVSQKGRAFAVHDVQIARGDTVRFTNDDEFIHQVYVKSPAFSYDSAEQEPGTTADVRFPAAGTFEVRCHIHPKMLLTVNVR